jgi:hypothetical protein
MTYFTGVQGARVRFARVSEIDYRITTLFEFPIHFVSIEVIPEFLFQSENKPGTSSDSTKQQQMQFRNHPTESNSSTNTTDPIPSAKPPNEKAPISSPASSSVEQQHQQHQQQSRGGALARGGRGGLRGDANSPTVQKKDWRAEREKQQVCLRRLIGRSNARMDYEM